MIDIIGILSFIGVVMTIIINFYMHKRNTTFEMVFNVAGSSLSFYVYYFVLQFYVLLFQLYLKE